MDILTNSQLVKIIADRLKVEPIATVTKDLNAKEVYVLQILAGKRPISKNIAARMGYKPVSQPKPEKLFQPISN